MIRHLCMLNNIDLRVVSFIKRHMQHIECHTENRNAFKFILRPRLERAVFQVNFAIKERTTPVIKTAKFSWGNI